MKKLISHSKPTLDHFDFTQLNNLFESKMISAGKTNLKFRNQLSKYLNKDYISLFSSGSSALFHILKSLNLVIKKEILVPNYICESVIKSICLAGLTPILYDNKPNSWVSSTAIIKDLINEKTGAIILNHTFGVIFKDIKDLSFLGIPIIEDCCHSFSTSIGDEIISKYSLCSFYSFDPTKWLTTGNGGAVASNNKELMNEIESIKLDAGLSDVNCSLGISQLNKIENFKSKRNEIAHKYFKEMSFITKELASYNSCYFRFPIIVNNSNSFLASKKVAFRKGVDSLLNTKYSSISSLINSKRIFNKTISIPIYPSLTTEMIDTIINETKYIYYGD